MPEAALISDGGRRLTWSCSAQHAMRLIEPAVAQKTLRRGSDIMAEAGLQMTRADPQLAGDVGNPDRLGDAGADQLAGAPDMDRTGIELLYGRMAEERRTQQTDKAVEKDFVIGRPQQLIGGRVLRPDETHGTAK